MVQISQRQMSHPRVALAMLPIGINAVVIACLSEVPYFFFENREDMPVWTVILSGFLQACAVLYFLFTGLSLAFDWENAITRSTHRRVQKALDRIDAEDRRSRS